MTVARDQFLKETERDKGVAYISEQTHFCIPKALRVIGLLKGQIRIIQCDDQFRMDPHALRCAISNDIRDGLKPFLIISTCGTTSTGSVDQLDEIADIAGEYTLWMHVDAAYGGSVAFSKSHRSLTKGLGRADSVCWDPHKWLFQTLGCSVVLFRDKLHPLQSFASTAHFLRDIEDDQCPQNPWNYGIELTRPARHMRLWFSLQSLGLDNISCMVSRGFELADLAEAELRKLRDWEIITPSSMAILNFRFAPQDSTASTEELDTVNTLVSRELEDRNIAAIFTTHLKGVVGLRICTINPRTTDDHICQTVIGLDQAARGIYKAKGHK